MNTSWYFGRESGDLPWYTLNAPSGILPRGLTSISVNGPFLSWSFNPTSSYAGEPRGSFCCQMLGQHLTSDSFSYDFTRGVSTWQPSDSLWEPSGTHTGVQVSLDYDIGYSYVAMGDWNWKEIATGNSGELLFVDGDRTPATGIPVSGTASYDARTLGKTSALAIPFTLSADFGQRLISTQIQAALFNVSGSGPFQTSGSFDISLNGSSSSGSATGMMNGAFFGPHAEQVGGTFSLQNGSGAQLFQDAFVGQQHQP